MSVKLRTAKQRAADPLQFAPVSTGIMLALAALSGLSSPAQAQDLGMIGDQAHSSADTMVDPLLTPGFLPDAVPFVQLDKSRFADGESVFFWVGVSPTGTKKPIPKDFRDTCRLYITRPDGTTKIVKIGWPLDGPEGSTWEGGWGLQEAAQQGSYKLVFEFAGQRSAPVDLVVEHVSQLEKIHAAFAFGSGTSGKPLPPGSPVTFTVENDSDQTIRFPRINGDSTSIWTSFAGEERRTTIETRYPIDKASDGIGPSGSPFFFTNFDWKLAGSVPTITLKPHETYHQVLSLDEAIAGARKDTRVAAGRYTVHFGTVLQVLLGDAGGELSTLEAVRLPVANSASCTVPAL